MNKWPHLGHIITDRLSDDIDVDSKRNSLIGQINNVLCYFYNLDSVTKGSFHVKSTRPSHLVTWNRLNAVSPKVANFQKSITPLYLRTPL